MRIRLSQWSDVVSLCDSAARRTVELQAKIEDPGKQDPVLVELMLPDGLSARVAGVVSSCHAGSATIALTGMTSGFCERLRALARPATEPSLARGSGTLHVHKLERPSLRQQIDLLASKMTPTK